MLDELHLTPLSSVVQLRPQLHHLDAFDEISSRDKAQSRSKRDVDDEGGPPRREPEPRAIDMKVKSAEGDTANAAQGNNEILQKMQDEKWEKYEWIDENVSFLPLQFQYQFQGTSCYHSVSWLIALFPFSGINRIKSLGKNMRNLCLISVLVNRLNCSQL